MDKLKMHSMNKVDENIEKIVSTCYERTETEYFSKLVPNDVIAEKEDYNLSVSTYIEQEDTSEKIDITELNAQIAEIVAKENTLRAEIDKIIKEIEG